VFTIWEAIVVGFGLSKFSGKSMGTSMSVSFLVFVLMAVASFALGFAR
jgi:VIT1/CCC1 family predicted Fe2+/Mn2+ transporter